MRQFDVFVFDDSNEFDSWKPSFEDPALGWFHTRDWNNELNELEAEWIIFAHPAISINRDFLNELAQETDGFPMVDAFAPRVRLDGHFYGGLLVNGSKGFQPISELEQMRFVAGPNPLVGVFSRRIIQRTGLFDQDIPAALRLLDYSLRMAHAGGRMFSVPYLVVDADQGKVNGDLQKMLDGSFLKDKSYGKAVWDLMYKTLPNSTTFMYSARHPTMMGKFFKTPEELDNKRDKATSLSKFTAAMLKDMSVTKA